VNQQNSILVKKSTKLFSDKYHYKVVLKTPAAHWFRPEHFCKIVDRIKDPNSIKKYIYNTKSLSEENGVEYVKKIYKILQKSSDYSIRVESPYLSVYTNDYKLIENLAYINSKLTKYISVPASKNLQPGEIYSKKLDFKYKIHFGSTTKNYKNFVDWCENNLKIKISRGSKLSLLKDKSYLGGYFYIKDEKTLTMVKIFLGEIIKKIETITKT